MTRQTITVVIRPHGARTEIRDLPWTGSPRATYALLEDAIGASRRGQVQYSRSTRAFSVARAHSGQLILSLADRFGHVHVIQHGGQTRCVSACWNADPNTAWECECSCAGSNHGTQRPLGRIVADVGDAGELSVARATPHEWDVYR
jgi:hypothetical protein